MTTVVHSRQLRAAIDSLRPEFSGFASDQAKMFARKSDLAPVFMKAFAVWERETQRGLVAFVRELDRTVPADRESYVHHPSIQAAWYLVRTARQAEDRTPLKARSSLTPLELLAIVIRSALPSLDDKDRAWASIAKVSRWHERDLGKLRMAVASARPLDFYPQLPRLVTRRQARTVGNLAIANDRG